MNKTVSLTLLTLLIIVTGTFTTIETINYFHKQNEITYPKPVGQIRATSDKEIVHGNTKKKQLIFTFDGGANAKSATSVLNVLAKHHVKGTFFLTGKFVETNPDIVKQMISGGHEIFNHTYDHPHLPKVTDIEIAEELSKMDLSLQKIGNISARPYFRPPYGDRDPRVLSAAFAAGYESVYWTVDARDWQESTGMTADAVMNRIISAASPGTIYLMHLGNTITGSILDDVFTELEGRGYKLVSLTEGVV